MNRHPSRAFRLWCAGLIVLVFSSTLPGSVMARVAPIELVKFQLRKPNFVIVVESAESMQDLPGENPARYNEVGVDCENGDRFCRLYGQKGRCEFSGMGKQGYVFDDVAVGTNTTTSTLTRTGGIKVVTESATGIVTALTTGNFSSTSSFPAGNTVVITGTGTVTASAAGTASETKTPTQTRTNSTTNTGITTNIATNTASSTNTGNTTSLQSSSTTTTSTGTTTPIVTHTSTTTGTATATGAGSASFTKTTGGTETATGAGNETFTKTTGGTETATGAGNETFTKTTGGTETATGAGNETFTKTTGNTETATNAGVGTLVKTTGNTETTTSAGLGTYSKTTGSTQTTTSAGLGTYSKTSGSTETTTSAGLGTYSKTSGSTETTTSAGLGTYSKTSGSTETTTSAGLGTYSKTSGSTETTTSAGLGTYSKTSGSTQTTTSAGLGTYSKTTGSTETATSAGVGTYKHTGTYNGTESYNGTYTQTLVNTSGTTYPIHPGSEVGYWGLDERAVTPDWGGTYSGVNTSTNLTTATASLVGHGGKALQFRTNVSSSTEITTNYASISAPAPSSNFTLAFFVNTVNGQQYQSLIDFYSGNNTNGNDSGGLRLSLPSGGNFCMDRGQSSGQLCGNLNTGWQFITLVVSSNTTWTMQYTGMDNINNCTSPNNVASGTVSGTFATAGTWLLGAGGSNHQWGLGGMMDEVHMWNTNLSAQKLKNVCRCNQEDCMFDQTVAGTLSRTATQTKTQTDTGYNSGMQTGSFTGYLTGNQTGSFTGYQTGNQTGSFTGYLTGNQTGSFTGYQTGNQTGSFTGYLTGNQTGSFTGYQTGNQTGSFTGYLTGNQTGIGTVYNTGIVTGTDTRWKTGMATGTDTRWKTGMTTGTDTRWKTGMATGTDTTWKTGWVTGTVTDFGTAGLTGSQSSYVTGGLTGTQTTYATGTITGTETSLTTGSASQVITVTGTTTESATVPSVVSYTDLSTNTGTVIGTQSLTATATTTTAVHPIPDTDDCDTFTSCSGGSSCYLQSAKVCSSNPECTFPGDFCRQIRLTDGTGRIRADSCITSNPANMICRYQNKTCTADSVCQAGTSGIDYCVTGAAAQMCQKTGLWCSVPDTNVQCSGSDDLCGPATSRMMMVKNAVRRVILDHAYDDTAVVKIGQMHTYQANGLGSTENLFPYVKLAEPTVTREEIKFLTRGELLRGTVSGSNSAACFSESSGPTGTCFIVYGGDGALTTPSVSYTLLTDVDKNDSRYAIPTGDGKTFAHADNKWASCGLSCAFPSASTAGNGLYVGSYYNFSYRSGVPVDPGADPNSPTPGSMKKPQYYPTYQGKSFGSTGNYWMLMDAERSDIANENKYGAHGFSGSSWSSSAEYDLPYSGANAPDLLSQPSDCTSSNGAQWDHNLVPMVNATTFGVSNRAVGPTAKALLNVARLEKNSFGGFHAVGNIAPVACALKNDGSNDSPHSVEGYMTAVKSADGSACWQNHVLLVVDGLPRGPGDLAIGGIDCSADACKYDSNPSLSGCVCPAVTKARSLAASGVNVHVIAATTDRSTINVYAAKTLNNIAIAGSTSASFINRPRYAASEDELYFWLNYEMKEALRVRVATTPASAASSSQTFSGVTSVDRLYQTVAELPEWRGSLLGFSLSGSGGTSTNTSTGTSTSTDVTYTTSKIWDAAKKNGWVSCSASDPLCTVPNDAGWKARNVFFSDANGVVRKITVDGSGSVDSDSKSALQALGLGANVNETERIVQWMLGKLDSSETLDPRPLNPAVMGSVVNSMPISVGRPGISLQVGGRHFYYAQINRPELVYVGADDGMLHAFYATDGSEAFAFIPADMVPVIAKLYAQGGQRYNPSEHIYGLSGSPKVKNLCVANCNPSTSLTCSDEQNGQYDNGCPVWKTVLIMTEGQGGHRPFALDITDPILSGAPNVTSNSLLWHVGYKNASALSASDFGDTISVPAFGYKKTTDMTDNRVLIASSYPPSGSTTKLLDAKLMDGSASGNSGVTMSGSGCTQDFGMVADVALARDYRTDGQQSLIAAYLADTHGKIHQYAPFYASSPDVMSLGCSHPLHFSPAVIQLNRNDANNVNKDAVYLAQVTNSLLDPVTRGSSTPSKLVVKKLTMIGNSPPAADATFGTSGEIHLSAGTSCTGTNCLCGVTVGIKGSGVEGCGTGGSTLPTSARPTGTPVVVLRSAGDGFQLYTTWYSPPADNWDNCQDSNTNGTSYITVHEFLAAGTWAQIAGIAIPHQYVTGVQFVGTTLFVTYGLNDKGPGAPDGSPNFGQTFVSASNTNLQTLASDRYVRTAWAERLDM